MKYIFALIFFTALALAEEPASPSPSDDEPGYLWVAADENSDPVPVLVDANGNEVPEPEDDPEIDPAQFVLRFCSRRACKALCIARHLKGNSQCRGSTCVCR